MMNLTTVGSGRHLGPSLGICSDMHLWIYESCTSRLHRRFAYLEVKCLMQILSDGFAHLRAHELNRSQFHVSAGNLAQAYQSDSLDAVINPKRLVKWLKHVEKMNVYLQDGIEFFDLPTLQILYEDFLHDPVATAR